MRSDRASAHRHPESGTDGAPLWGAAETRASSAKPFLPEASGPGDNEQSEPDTLWPIEVDADPREANLDAAYWLRHCHGFLVDSESGEDLGVVDDVELAPDSDETVSLIVASGWFGRHIRRIAVADVQAIVTSERRLIVSDDAVLPGAGGHGRS